MISRRPFVLSLLAGGLAVVAIAAGLGVAAVRGGSAATPAEAATEEPGDGTVRGAAASHGESDEVRRLRAQLRAKDDMIRTLTAGSAQGEARHAAELSAAAAEARRTPEDRAASILDARLAAAPAAPLAKAELERALRPALDPARLGQARVDDLRCAGALCKIALSAPDDAAIVDAVNGIAESPPKGYEATIVYTTGQGARSIYFGKLHADLALAPAEPDGK
jgi:hypothetical protein